MRLFPELSPGFVRRALSGHAAIGLLAGGLLYLLSLSGALIVVHEEWQRWEQPGVAEMVAIEPAAVQRAARAVLASEAGKTPTEHFYVHLPTDALPRTVVTTDHQAKYVDAEGRIAEREAHSWTEFVTGLHYYLHLPQTIGLIVVGALGVMMAALIIGGVLAHPRIFRDAFRLRARGQRQLAFADWHNRLGVWTLPFGLAIAITGALIGLATVAAFAMAATWYGGDMERAYAPVFGDEPAHNDAPAPLADIAGALRYMADARPEVRPTYVILHEPETQGQYLTVLAEHQRRLIYGETYAFDAQGRFTHTTGMSDGAIGKQVAASTYRLHFGSFGGLPVKLAYVLLGGALMVVSATGMSIWLMKRRQRGRPGPRLEAMWTAILWGAPVMLAVAYAVRAAFGPDAPLVAVFWAGYAAMIGAAIAAPHAALAERMLRTALAALLVGIGAAHLVAALSAGATGPIVIDAVLIATGTAIGLATWRSVRRVGADASAQELITAPAE